MFHPTFGELPLPYFFDAAPIRATPLSSPWDWFRSLLVPWLVAAAPLAGIAIWASAFVVVLSFMMEFALLRLDPRVRAARQL
jgi:hypothetical protein